MPNIELKNEKLKKHIQMILEKQPNEPITDEDLKNISSLKLDKKILGDLSIDDLALFKNLQSLSLSGINIGEKEILILNQIQSIQTLSISNAKINPTKIKYLNTNLQNLIFVNCDGVNVSDFCSNKSISNLTIVNCKNPNLQGISEFENLKEIHLPNNKDLTNSDLNDLWNVKNLTKVNLDGNTQISKIEHDGISISHRSEYTPTESKDWHTNYSFGKTITLDSISKFSAEQLETLSGTNITIDSSNLELVKSKKGQEILATLSKHNKINLKLQTTADLDLKSMETLNNICNFNRVYIQTGWCQTQNKGYSYQTYKAIKQEITKMVADIDPKLSEEQKYIELRKKITQNIKYDYAVLHATQDQQDYYSSRNLENGLLHHTCVCAGYADIFKNVLAEVGIQSKYVEGKTNKGELHAWNQIRLKGDDGEYHWYNDDITFDATGNDKFKYSLLNDHEFSKTHKFIPERTEGYSVHACNAPAPSAVRATKNPRRTVSQNDYER